MISAPRLDSRFVLAPEQAEALANEFGTPLYVVDERHFRERIRTYLEATQSSSLPTEISFASKANSTVALLKIAFQEGCRIDAASEGELRAAMAAGVPASACHLHGNNKTEQELEFAIAQGIGHIVADHAGELDMIKQIVVRTGVACPPIVLRLAPGVDPITHAKISTGQSDTKFGFNIQDGSAEEATGRCLELDLNLIGFHCHVGSQLLDPDAQRTGGELIARFAAAMRSRFGFQANYLNVGGGLGVRYTDADQPIGISEYCRLVSETVGRTLCDAEFGPVTLGHEPGRSLVAESGVTLYRVGVIKSVPASASLRRTYVSVDGGLSDNPRPALYGSRYTVLPVGDSFSHEQETVTVSGKHCETDKLFEDVSLPRDLKVGSLLQVLCTGAYNSSMASNYNRYPRPACALIRASGEFHLILRRESWSEMLSRENLPGDL